MEKVTGIGGLFFRVRDPELLSKWYEQHLGIAPAPTSEGETVWEQEAGQTVFSPFPDSSDYFGDPSKVWMVNFRVRDMIKIVEQLRASGISVDFDGQVHSIGAFARLRDPEGNPIELWEPPAG
jgi:glyoxylase I family protein